MRIGIMSFAHLHAESYIHHLRLLKGVELMGIADDDLQRGRDYAQANDTHLYASYHALLEDKPDGVIICSENVHHRPLVEMAAAAGAHILCEKPLATTLEDGQAMLQACRQADVLLMTAFPMRFSAPMVEVKAQIDAGSLGKIYCFNSTNQGRMPIHARRWFVDKELAGGGSLMDHIVHLADILRWYLDSEVTEVYAVANRILHKDLVEVETGGLIMLTFADGTFASIDCSWSKPFNYPTWGGLTMELISERGLTVVDAFRQNLRIHQQEPPAHAWAFWGSNIDRGMVKEFIDAIREGRQAKVTGEDGYKALEITLAAYESAASGQAVRLG